VLAFELVRLRGIAKQNRLLESIADVKQFGSKDP
jgi:hypothetical protein